MFHGYFPLYSLIFILWSYAMYGRKTETNGNMLIDFGLLNTMIAALVVMSLIMMLMRTYSTGIKVEPSYVNSK